MSIQVMTLVWKNSSYQGERLLVLLALADWANDSGVCWPSMPAIAAKARITERGARGIIKTLVDDGVLVIAEIGGGRGNSTTYQINVETLHPETLNGVPGLQTETRNVAAETRNVEAPKPGRRLQRNKEEPSLEPSLEPTTSNSFSLRSKEGVEEVVIPDKKSNPKAKTDSPDPRHVEVREFIKKCWLFANRGASTAPWAAAEAKLLSQILKDNPNWPTEHFIRCVRNRFRSEVNNSEQPRRWLGSLASYFTDPLDRFGRPHGQQQSRANTKQQQNIEAVVGGLTGRSVRMAGGNSVSDEQGLHEGGGAVMGRTRWALPSGKD